MKSLGIASAFQDTAGKLINNFNLTVVGNNVVAVAPEKEVCL